jgi:hypothetical protein
MSETKIASALRNYRECLVGRDKAEESVQESLGQLREVVGISTFELSEQWYQIRERKGRLYLCELDGKPKGRPKKTVEQKAHDKAEREQRRASELEEDAAGSTGEDVYYDEATEAPIAGGSGDGGDGSADVGGSASGANGAAVSSHASGDLRRGEASGEYKIPVDDN